MVGSIQERLARARVRTHELWRGEARRRGYTNLDSWDIGGAFEMVGFGSSDSHSCIIQASILHHSQAKGDSHALLLQPLYQNNYAPYKQEAFFQEDHSSPFSIQET